MKYSHVSLSQRHWFCNRWPAAREVLDFIGSLTKNPLIKVACFILRKIGDEIHKEFCPPS